MLVAAAVLLAASTISSMQGMNAGLSAPQLKLAKLLNIEL